ncbi:MAG: serine hydrolase domain-containing protein [Nannocystaceae bacterium]|nr:beta-lactamase family protein [bacterium]
MRERSKWSLLLVALALGCAKPAAPAPAPPKATPAPQEAQVESARDRFVGRFDTLTERLEEGLTKHHVPGMAVAVVYDDSVIYARGFGFSDLEREEKVTPRTRFAIGSSTKAFTATVIGQLVDEGKMTWDDPITTHVPEFVLDVKSDDAAAQVTIRDALCHRTGFTRMGVLWASGDVPRGDFLAQASKAEPLAPFREKFLYNNVTYTAAGEASARVADVMWAELVTQRILEPLGMRNSVVLAEEAKRLGMAQGYKWNEASSAFDALPMRSLDEIAPAGAINSTVLDMTAWLRFQINRGIYRGDRLIKAKTLAETWTPQIDVGGDVKYGLGWFIEDYEGQPMLHHGGNIDGYSAMVSFLPEERLGFVMLSNVSFSAMQNAVRGVVYDTLLEEEAQASPAGDEDLSTFEGKYLAGFGPFSGKFFTVTSEDGVLFVDVPGQQNYELEPPGEDGKRSFALTKTIAVRFERDESGVNVMHLYQGGFDFELFREGYVPEAEIPLDSLEGLLGEYEHSVLGRAKVLVRNNRLAIDVPKQMVYELHPPDEQGKWRFRVKDDIAVEFSPKDEPKKVVLHQGGKTFDLVRVAKKPAKGGPTAATLEKLRKSKRAERAFATLGILQMSGDVRFVQSGVSGTVTVWLAPDGRIRARIDLGKFGWSDAMSGPDGGWEVSAFGPREDLVGKRLEQALLLSPTVYARSFGKVFDEVTVEGTSTIDGREVIEAVLSKGELPDLRATLDAKTGDIASLKYEALWSGPGTISTTETLSEYRSVMGLRLPHAIDRSTQQSGTVRITNIEYEEVSEIAGLFPKQPPAR